MNMKLESEHRKCDSRRKGLMESREKGPVCYPDIRLGLGSTGVLLLGVLSLCVCMCPWQGGRMSESVVTPW